MRKRTVEVPQMHDTDKVVSSRCAETEEGLERPKEMSPSQYRSRENVSFPFFKYVSLLASVSEFYCFLPCRCSMEMWCPDDIGRDSWDWVGPPTWERA